MSATKINKLAKKIYKKIRRTPNMSKIKTTDQATSDKNLNSTEKTSPINTLNILQRLEQMQTTIQPIEDELSFT